MRPGAEVAVVLAALAALFGTCRAANRTRCLGDESPGGWAPVPVNEVPADLAALVATTYIDSFVGQYGPWMGCRGFSTVPTGGCRQLSKAVAWQIDVAATCTDGSWDHGVQTIILHGEVQVPAGADQYPTVTSAVMGVEIQPLEAGDGAKPKRGDNVTTDYSLYYSNGTLLQTTIGDEPIQFTLGVGQVILGWDQGVAQMNQGERAVFIVRSDFAYGPEGAGEGVIPPNATLVFDVTLLDIQPS